MHLTLFSVGPLGAVIPRCSATSRCTNASRRRKTTANVLGQVAAVILKYSAYEVKEVFKSEAKQVHTLLSSDYIPALNGEPYL